MAYQNTDPYKKTLCSFIVFVVAYCAPKLVWSQTVSQLCPSKCGNVSIPYPFGVGEGCSLSSQFTITCNSTGFDSPRPFLRKSTDFIVDEISLNGELRMNMPFDSYCPADNNTVIWQQFSLSSFSFSSTRNKFTAIGCNTLASIYIQEDGVNSTDSGSLSGCYSTCSSLNSVTEGSCDGRGCCQTVIPKRLTDYIIIIQNATTNSSENVSRCKYAFIVEENAFNFSRADVVNMDNRTTTPVVVDWAVWNDTCKQAQTNISSYACKAENSFCYNPENINGYRCNCSNGYQGNPYLVDGCKDIDECKDSESNLCSNVCHNTLGGSRCSCPAGYYGDGKKDGDGCRIRQTILVSIIVGVAAVLFGIGGLYIGIRKRKLILLKEKYFKQNGGVLLQQQLHGRDGSSTSMAKIFTAEELEKATDNYAEDKVAGRGGYGTVYKGILSDGRIVAIKKSKQVDQAQIEQFVNEVIVLSQINHRNVVKLLGCCLETEVPLLVYEFVSNGTLFEHIHSIDKNTRLSWETRLRIGTETAGVLSYLHSAASIPIIHRDIKSTNILLDEQCNAKVSDFGASRLVPLDQDEMSTMVQGTLGYLDPEYLHSSTLTEKSDVYSFGVVLVELMTGQKALSFDKPEEQRSLAMHFMSTMKDDRLFEIIDDSIVKNDLEARQVKEVAILATRCLRIKGDDRPTMKEVSMELEGIRVTGDHPWVEIDLNAEETENLLGEAANSGGHIESTMFNSLSQTMPPLAGGR